MRVKQAVVALGVAVALSVTACSGQAGGSGGATGGATLVADALAALPAVDRDGASMILIGDLTAATEAAGLERPAEFTELHGWLNPLMGLPGIDGPAPAFVPLPDLFQRGSIPRHAEFAEELGWSLLDVSWFAQQGMPPHVYTVVAGEFEDSALAHLPEIVNQVHTAGEGGDFETDLQETTPARPLGAPLRLASRDGLIAAGPATGVIADWVVGNGATYAEADGYATVAAALDDAGVVSAALARGLPWQGSAGPADAFDVVGIGWGVDDGASIITLAYHFTTDGAAQAAVADFEDLFANGILLTGEPLADKYMLENATHHEALVLLTLSLADGVSPAMLIQQLQRVDLPFVHR